VDESQASLEQSATGSDVENGTEAKEDESEDAAEELPELESPRQMINHAVDIIKRHGGEIERPKLLYEMDMQPDKAKAVIEKGLQRGDLIKTPNGEICHD
jgi:predicted transcriptional regulator